MKTMKPILLLMVAGYIPLLLTTNNTYAQSAANFETQGPQNNDIAFEKRVSPVNTYNVDMEVISPKAIKTFAKSYKNVSGESWEKIKDGYSVKFTSAGVRTRVYFDNKGKWTGSLKGYKEDKLSAELRHQVKSSYYDYSITYVQEVETIDSYKVPTYIIHLEDAHNIKQLRIFDGQMETWKEFKKG